jgi:transketolase
VRVAERDDRVFLVVGDLGFGVVEGFQSRFPNRFLNAGVAEQNMTAVAAGLAMCGKTVFTYSIANFPTLRCLEQIRNDVCYHNANVKVVSVGGGFAYGALGMTHHATEDLAVMRALPNMTVVAPGDPREAEAATEAVVDRPGPCYLRLGRAGEQPVHPGIINFQLGKAIVARDGGDATIISSGGMLLAAMRAAELLSGEAIDVRVLSMHTIKPLDEAAVLQAAEETGALVTLEEHSIVGGLGGAVAELIAEQRIAGTRFQRIGLPSSFSSHVGGQEYLQRVHGLSPESVANSIRQLLSAPVPSLKSV